MYKTNRDTLAIFQTRKRNSFIQYFNGKNTFVCFGICFFSLEHFGIPLVLQFISHYYRFRFSFSLSLVLFLYNFSFYYYFTTFMHQNSYTHTLRMEFIIWKNQSSVVLNNIIIVFFDNRNAINFFIIIIYFLSLVSVWNRS